VTAFSSLARRLALPLLLLPLLAPAAAGETRALPPRPGQFCRAAIVTAERNFAIPTGLLGAIGQVESGRRDPTTGAYLPWPWTVDANGDGHFYPTKAAAIAAVRGFRAAGIRSIDVGCMQVNLLHHPDAFATLDEAFDPPSNAAYAAQFLRQLHDSTGSWAEAAAFYHSTTPALAYPYEREVMKAWPAALREAAGVPANLPSGPLTPPPMLAQNGLAQTGPFADRAGAFMLSNRPLGVPTTRLYGRTLASYRAAPVMMASRAFHSGG
jgi:Transglycosylase SLT domain